jgi:hypothetical protein
MAITKQAISGSEKTVPANTKTIKKAPDVPGLSRSDHKEKRPGVR